MLRSFCLIVSFLAVVLACVPPNTKHAAQKAAFLDQPICDTMEDTELRLKTPNMNSATPSFRSNLQEIVIRVNGERMCNGVIISSDFIGTSGRCIESISDGVTVVGFENTNTFSVDIPSFREFERLDVKERRERDFLLIRKTGGPDLQPEFSFYNGNNLPTDTWIDCYMSGTSFSSPTRAEYDEDSKKEMGDVEYEIFLEVMRPGEHRSWPGSCMLPQDQNGYIKMRVSMYYGLSGSPVLIDSQAGPLVIALARGYYFQDRENGGVSVLNENIQASLRTTNADFSEFDAVVEEF